MELKEKFHFKGGVPTMVGQFEQSKSSYEQAMRVFIKPFLVENANGGFNVKLLACLYI